MLTGADNTSAIKLRTQEDLLSSANFSNLLSQFFVDVYIILFLLLHGVYWHDKSSKVNLLET